MKRKGQIVFDPRLNHSGDGILLECCQRAKEFEAAGDYEAARNELMGRGRWAGAGHRPVLDGLGERAAGELLLRSGALTGWLGSSQQLADSQETAKDLIYEGARIFEALEDRGKVAEARIELALCYWRQAAFDEARVTLQSALDLLGDSDPKLRAVALLRAVTVEWSDGRFHAALRMLEKECEFFGTVGDDYLQGCFYSMRALTYKNLLEAGGPPEYADRALLDYTAASCKFEQAGHARYHARNENNIGHLLIVMGRHADAHEHLSYARGLFAGLKDLGSVALVDETRARAFIAEGRFDKAEEVVGRAITLLERGGEQAFLAEALITSGVALARMGRADEARSRLRRAVEAAETAGAAQRAADAVLTLIEEMHRSLSPEEVCDAYETAERLAGANADPTTLLRLRECAMLLHALVRRLLSAEVPCDLNEKVRLLERRHIQEALRVADGGITGAARLLGFKHPQSLTSIMQSRHKDLLGTRRPPVRRHRSLMTPRAKR
jgi:tetratricopeptide (TPR) repeat protein